MRAYVTEGPAACAACLAPLKIMYSVETDIEGKVLSSKGVEGKYTCSKCEAPFEVVLISSGFPRNLELPFIKQDAPLVILSKALSSPEEE